MSSPGYINGIGFEEIQLRRQRSRGGDAGTTRVGLRSRGRAGTPRPQQVRMTAWAEGEGKERRVRALDNMAALQEFLVIEKDGNPPWLGEGALIGILDGDIRLRLDEGPMGLRLPVQVVGYNEDARYEAVVESVIQDNTHSDAGETRCAIPGQATVQQDGGTLTSEGKWVTDPSPFGGESFSADEPLSNFGDEYLALPEAQHWTRHQPWLVPFTALDTDHTPLGSATGDPSSVDVSSVDARQLISVGTYTWDGSSKAIPLDALDNFTSSERRTVTAPPRASSGTYRHMWRTFLPRDSDSISTIELQGGTGLSGLELEVYDLDQAYALDDGEAYSEFAAGIGAAQAYFDQQAMVAHATQLNDVNSGGDWETLAVLFDSSPSWWKLVDFTPDRVLLRSDQGDEVWLWVNGLTEFSAANGLTVQPADTSQSTGNAYWQPHSARDVRFASLEDYSASISSGQASVSESTSGQRFGLGFGSNPSHFFRRTRTRHRMEV